MKLLYSIIACCLLISYTTFSQTISSNAPLCGNANLTLELTATGGSTYAWKGPNSFTSTQQKPSIKNVNYRNRGVYTVMVDNKTMLTADVNIKDPVAFTVPKEISVCEGGTLIIEPKSGRLTDSTEVMDFFGVSNSLRFIENGVLGNFSNNDVGEYKISGYSRGSSFGCTTTQSINVKISKDGNCKKITIEDLEKVKMCYNQDIVIPFSTSGIFKQGTKFKAYILKDSETFSANKEPYTIVEKSPVVLKNLAIDSRSIKILIIADDLEKTSAISNVKFLTFSYIKSNNNIVTTSTTCDSAKLSFSGSAFINTQWLLDSKGIIGASNPLLVAKKSGTYSYTFKLNFSFSEIDKTCLYESQPVKIGTELLIYV